MRPYHVDDFLRNTNPNDFGEDTQLLDVDADGWQGYAEWSSSIGLAATLGQIIATCELCAKPVYSSQGLNRHHPIPRSENGRATIAVHQVCHIEHHRANGDYIRWGRIGGLKSASRRAERLMQ